MGKEVSGRPDYGAVLQKTRKEPNSPRVRSDSGSFRAGWAFQGNSRLRAESEPGRGSAV